MPRGRPKGHKPLIDVLGQRRRVELIELAYAMAKERDVGALRMLLDRTDPTLTKTQLAGDHDQPIALEHAEREVAEISTDVLEELDALAQRIQEKRLAAQATHPSPDTKQ